MIQCIMEKKLQILTILITLSAQAVPMEVILNPYSDIEYDQINSYNFADVNEEHEYSNPCELPDYFFID